MKQKLLSNSIRYVVVLSFIILSSSYFTACNEDDNTIIPPVKTTALSVTHASPDAPNVDIYVGNTLVAQSVPYLATLPYIELVPGLNEIIITVTGSVTALIDTTVFLQQDYFYSIFAIDSLSDIQPLVLTDNLELPGSTNANIRFINLSPNSPTVDIQAQGKTIPWFPFYSFPEATDFRAVTAGTYNIDMNIAGSSTLLASLTDAVLTQGYIYTLISNGFNGASGTQAIGLTLITNYPFQSN